MSKSLDDLSEAIRPKVDNLLSTLRRYGIPITIIDVLRTSEEQKQNVAKGVSWTLNSKHLPDKNGKSNAIDIAPTALLSTKNYSPESPLWSTIGEVAKINGLSWGVVKNGKRFDLGHLYI